MTNTVEAPPNSGNRLPEVVLVDPTTGNPYSAGGGAGYTGSAATAPGTNGTTATPVQGVSGGVPVAVSWTGQTVGVTEADGANAALGSKNDPAAGGGTTTGTAITWMSGTFKKQPSNITFFESQTALGASATFTGTARNTSIGSNAYTPFAYFTAVAFADQTGTLFVDYSADGGTTWKPANGTAGTAVAAGATVNVKVPLAINVARVRFTNGATAQGSFLLLSMFSAA